MQGLRAIWEERRLKLGPLKRQTQRVRRNIGDMFAELSLHPAKSSVDYSHLMAAGEFLTLGLCCTILLNKLPNFCLYHVQAICRASRHRTQTTAPPPPLLSPRSAKS